MSLQEATPLRPARTPDVFTKARRSRALPSVPIGVVALFVVAYAGYAVLGYFTVLRWHIVVGDGVSRLTHAYMVWFNQPPKLAAIGFVWPPLMTIVLLPLAAIKPVATSLLALPLTSAFFAAALVVTLDRALALLDMRWWARLPLVVLVSANPIILYYGGNGMAEVVYLFLLTFAVFAFLRWYLQPSSSALVLCSVTMAFAVLTRYEILVWAFTLSAAIMGVLIRRRETRAHVEGSTIAFLAPILYGFGLWLFFNWLILGDPLYWLHSEVTQTFVETRSKIVPPPNIAIVTSARTTLSLTWHLFPATLIVAGVLAAVAVWRRDLVSFLLSFLIALNPLVTAFLATATHTEVVFQLRYNLRSLPLSLIGLAWLWRLAPGRMPRLAVWVGAVALLAGSMPSTWHMMKTWQQQALEQAFTRAVTTGQDQEGKRSLGIGVPVGTGPERAASRWILDHAQGPSSVLADDAQAFEVILFTGRPGMFLDRTDRGDVYWKDALDNPVGRVRYFLVSKQGHDLIRDRYPSVLSGGVPWLRPVWSNARWTVVRVRPRVFVR